MSINQNENTIFVCSSLIDIGEILYQIDHNKLSNFQIIVTTDIQCYNLLVSITSKEKVIFLGSKLLQSPKNIFLWIKEIMIILYLKFLFKNHNIKKVFFYAPLYDLLASYIVLKIFHNSKIILSRPVFYEMSEYTPVYQKTLLNRLYSTFYGFDVITYNNYRVKIFGNYIPGLHLDIISSFDLSDFASMDEIRRIQQEYWIEYRSHSIENTIIIIDQSLLDMKIMKNFESRMKEINDVIKPYQIFIKERYIADNINEPNTIFENYKYKKLTAKFSVEYYNLLSTHCIIGIYSSALARLAHDRRISLLNLFEYYDDSDRKQWKNYLDKLSNDIIYPNSIEELKELIVDAEK